jgi:hypothetical protein
MYKIGYFATDCRRFFEERDDTLLRGGMIRLMEGREWMNRLYAKRSKRWIAGAV